MMQHSRTSMMKFSLWKVSRCVHSRKAPSWMLAWVLNTHLLLPEDSSKILFLFKVLYIIRLLKFTAFNSSNMLLVKYLIIKPFDLLNNIPMTRTETLLNNMLMRKINEKQLSHAFSK